EDLRRTLWPEDTFIDFDHSWGTGINKLREVLGDSAANPRFIETLPRRGYRFIAPIELVGMSEEASVVNEAPPKENEPATESVPGPGEPDPAEPLQKTEVRERPSWLA